MRRRPRTSAFVVARLALPACVAAGPALPARNGRGKPRPYMLGISGVLPAVVAFVLLSLAGCGKIPQNHYYTLESSLPAPPAASTTLPVEIAVARFRAAQALSQDRLVFRPAPQHLDFYEYHRWVDTPPDLVTQNLITHFKRSGMFRSVTGIQGATQADYLLRGYVEHLEEVDSDGSVTARVALAAELVDTKTRAVVWTGRGSQDVAVNDRSIEGVVHALNEALRQSMDQLLRGLATYFQQRPAR